MSGDRVIDVVVRAAADATGAGAGWVLAPVDGHLEVVATVGAAGALDEGMRFGEEDGSAGFVYGSGQPIAVRPRAGDRFGSSGAVGRLESHPTSLLSLPCAGPTGTVGVLELVDRFEGAFSVDDLELATLLSTVAAAVLSNEPTPKSRPEVVEPGARLRALATEDPERHRQVLAAIDLLLAP